MTEAGWSLWKHRLHAASVLHVVVAGALLAMGFVGLAGHAGASPASTRVAGDDRYATAVAISRQVASTGPIATVYVATGTTFPDALAASAVAGRSGLAAPLLLVTGTTLPPVTAAELARLRPLRIVLLGGQNAISPVVEQQLRAYSGLVSRVSGADRYETAALLATTTFLPGTVDTAYVVTGERFADAVLAGSVAGRAHAPVLLVGGGGVPGATVRALEHLRPARVTIVGDVGAVTEATAATLGRLTRDGSPPRRIAGSDPFQTSVAVSTGHNPSTTPVAFLATGRDFPDALAVGGLASMRGAPLLFSDTTCMPPAVDAELRRLAPATIVIVGGEAALSSSVEQGLVCGAAKPPAVQPAKLGVSAPGVPTDLRGVETFETLVGQRVATISYFQDFASGPTFDAASATAIHNRGAVPMLAWQPERGGDGATQPAYALGRIIAGDHDALVTRWAEGLRDWGNPFMLRFAPEMNGNWTPWSEGVNGNTPGQYVAAWRHVHDIFSRVGATNVTWVWNPMVSFEGSTPLAGLYPGDAYVDVVGFDGYNWGTSQPWSRWQSPAEVFGPSVAEVQALTSRPIILCEVASSEAGGDKARWIAEFFSFLRATPAITEFHWFNFNKESDWRVESSPASLAAFRAGLGG